MGVFLSSRSRVTRRRARGIRSCSRVGHPGDVVRDRAVELRRGAVVRSTSRSTSGREPRGGSARRVALERAQDVVGQQARVVPVGREESREHAARVAVVARHGNEWMMCR
jgi:hypothetical protein